MTKKLKKQEKNETTNRSKSNSTSN